MPRANTSPLEYNLQNAVAEYEGDVTHWFEIGGTNINVKERFLFRAYNSQTKNVGKIKIRDRTYFDYFLQGAPFDIIAIYELNSYKNQPVFHDKPSAIIFNSEGITYIQFDIKEQYDSPDGDINYFVCTNSLIPRLKLPALVNATASAILARRFFDERRSDDFAPLPEKTKEVIM